MMGRNYQTFFREAVTAMADEVGHHHVYVVLDILKKALAKGGEEALVKELHAIADLEHVKDNADRSVSDRARIDLSNLCEDLESAYSSLVVWAGRSGDLKDTRGAYLRDKIEALGESPLQDFGIKDRRSRQEYAEMRRRQHIEAATRRGK